MAEAAPEKASAAAPVTGPQGDPDATEPEEAIYDRVLGGEFNNIPPTARKLVRIFTSSTFTGIFQIYNN